MGNSVSGHALKSNCNRDGDFQIQIISFENVDDIFKMDGVISVAEIMLRFPGYFVSEFTELAMAAAARNITSPSFSSIRITAMAADAKTQPGRVYVLFKMQKLHSRVPIEQLEKVFSSSTAPQRQFPAAVYGKKVNKTVSLDSDQRQMNKTKNEKPIGGCERSFVFGGLRGTSRRVAKVTPLVSGPAAAPTSQESCPGITNGYIHMKFMNYGDSVSKSGSFHTSVQLPASSGTLHRQYWTPKLETISEL